MKKDIIHISLVIIILLFLTPTLISQTYGDVNSSGDIDIVDALLTAQFYVGLQPLEFNQDAADVSADGSIDIIDALLIAQYYVGLITEFPINTATPTPDPGCAEPTLIPTSVPGTTLPPLPTGHNTWTRTIFVYDAVASGNPPVSGAYVQGIAMGSIGVDSENTNVDGNCTISLTALDTGSVVITVIKCGYVTSETEYPGLPLNGTIDIGLEPEP